MIMGLEAFEVGRPDPRSKAGLTRRWLREHGPATAEAIAEHFGWQRVLVDSMLSNMLHRLMVRKDESVSAARWSMRD